MITEQERNYRIKNLKNMDKVIRYVNDEENGVIDTWLMGGVPDGSTEQDFKEYAEDEEMYNDCCKLFAELISDMLVNGYWDKNGYTREFFNVDAYYAGKQGE